MSGYTILLLAGSLNRKGGVADFCRMLLANLGPGFCADHLVVGKRSEQKSFVKSSFYLIYTACKLIAKLWNGHYDVVHVNPSFKIYSLLRDSLYLWLIDIFGYGRRTIVFFHGWDDDLAKWVLRSSFSRRIFVRIYRGINTILVLHGQCKEQLVDIGINPDKIKVTTTMYERIDGIKNYSRTKIEAKVDILFMSRFVEDKGVDIVLKTAKLLVENGYSNFHLTLAGDGPLLPMSRKFVTENSLTKYVDIPGYVRGEAKLELLRKGDIFLFPTWYKEGCPIVVLEAMGAGLAVVATPRGAIPDILEQGKQGFICDSKDPADFYKALKTLLDDRGLLSEMQKSAKKTAEENYEASVFTRTLEETYLSIIEGTSS